MHIEEHENRRAITVVVTTHTAAVNSDIFIGLFSLYRDLWGMGRACFYIDITILYLMLVSSFINVKLCYLVSS